MADLTWNDGDRVLTATISGVHQDPQTRAKTIRLTIADGDDVLWRDFVRAKPISAGFLQELLADEAGVRLPDDKAMELVGRIYDA